MIRRYHLLFVFLLCVPAISGYAQDARGWQQRVHYDMRVTLYADRHLMDGRQRLVYENHSPDTLRRVFYHLYFNAFQPHSMMAERNRRLPDPDPRIVPRIFNLGPDEIGYHRIESLTQDGLDVAYDIDDTVMEVDLAKPIPPGGTAVFEMTFRSQIPLQTRRSGRDNLEGIDYSMTQWYPKMANYDERGWHADPYVGREFYAPFGTFDVRIKLPSAYTIGATGVLQNAEDIGHGYAPGPEVYSTDSLTWHFRAENVHDFAWSADPDYVHDIVETGSGTPVHLLYQPDVADVWRGLHQAAPAIMDYFSFRFGRYPYPQVTVAQGGDGGMEYPMITLVTGRRGTQSLLGVTAHELAHMWFYAVLGSNEADYAWMDEGFTGFATTEVFGRLAGNPRPSHASAHLSVLEAQHFDLFERLNTPADWYRTNYAYSVAAYSGGEALIDMLGYVISDSLLNRFFDAYFDRFKFGHPGPRDVEKVAEDVSGLRLDWYFEQFANSTWTLDYAVDDVRSSRTAGGWETVIILERASDAVLPVDLQLTLADGSVQWVNVPLSIMAGHKPVPDDWIVAEPWHWTSPQYTLRLRLPERVVRAEIDPNLRTTDIDRLNNVDDFPVEYSFLEAPGQSWSTYQVGWRPLAQYAHLWGVGGGLQFRGTYYFDQLQTKATIKLWPEVIASGGEKPRMPTYQGDFGALDGVDFDLRFSDPVRLFGRHGTLALQSRKHLGILENEATLSAMLGRFDLLTDIDHRLTLGFTHQVRTSDRALATHVAAGFGVGHMFSGRAAYEVNGSRGRAAVGFEAGGGSQTGIPFGSANRAFLDAEHHAPLGPVTESIRLFIGTGGRGLSLQNRYRLGAATFEERWGNDAYRGIGAAFADPLGDAHWVAFGLPGPVAYMRTEHETATGDVIGGAPVGRHIAAASARLLTRLPSEHALAAPLRLELFVGAGGVWTDESFSFNDLLFDGGLGIHYDVSSLTALQRWTAQSDVLSNLKLTARFPIWVSDVEAAGREQSFEFQWLLGVTVDELPGG